MLAHAFVGTASRYWLDVFPLISCEVREWHSRAWQIPDPLLRRLAVSTQRSERGNLEGAAAFAVLAPRAHRRAVVRAAVAFQALYDYIDTLAELPCADPAANGRQLHLALLAALDLDRAHTDYYRHCPGRRDNDYMRGMIETCRQALSELPSFAATAAPALCAVGRMVDYQTHNHFTDDGHGPRALACWAQEITPAETDLAWWETAAGAASSLIVFALFTAAAKPSLDEEETLTMERAYFPWIGALHVLLDSLVDHRADLANGHHSLVSHYPSPQAAAARLSTISLRAVRAAEAIPQGIGHMLILGAMASFYLSLPCVSDSPRVPAAQQVLQTLGALASPSMAVLRARRAIAGRGGRREGPFATFAPPVAQPARATS